MGDKDEIIFSKMKVLMDQLDQNAQLQDLAERSGVDAVNSIRLTPTTKDNIAVSVIALSLASIEQDPQYKNLVHLGLKKRSAKVELINKYKDRAIQLIQRYRDSQ